MNYLLEFCNRASKKNSKQELMLPTFARITQWFLIFFYVNSKNAKVIVTLNNLLNKDAKFFVSEKVINSKEGFYLGKKWFLNLSELKYRLSL